MGDYGISRVGSKGSESHTCVLNWRMLQLVTLIDALAISGLA